MIKAISFLLALGAIAALPTEASAWYCRATSPTGGWGWGRSFFRNQAGNIALANCAVNTPRGYVCVIRYCNPYQ